MASVNRGFLNISQGVAALQPISIPKLLDDSLLVRTVAVALNPTDWQTVDESPKKGSIPSVLGCDAAGIVNAVGKGATKKFNIGDRVAGAAHGGRILCFTRLLCPLFHEREFDADYTGKE